ncbi:MAG: hypothetical protein WC291_00905 [Thermodesulfovibrionales bacterium]|jgi:hypothetical protein
MNPSESILDHVVSALRDLPQGEAGRKATDLAGHYGVSRATIYRWAALRGLRWRKERTTKGQSAAKDEDLQRMAAILLLSRRTSNEIPIPACDAFEMLQDSGVDMGVSVSRATSLLREKEISARDLLRPTPHQTMRSSHPNHVWQFDVTNCLQYFLDDQKGMGERDADMVLYKNKIVKTAKEIKKELLRYVAVDHCTGAFYFRYFYASGERAIDGSNFLYEAMAPKDELIKATWNGTSGSKLGKYHFHGVPFMLIPDRGSIITDKGMENLFKGLRIEVEPHMPGNPRAKGAVEGMMKHLNKFEGKLKCQRPRSLEELNAWALDYAIYINGVKEMRDTAPRSAMWSTIRPEQLRLCPSREVWQMLLRRPELDKRCDGGGYVHHNNLHYRVPDVNACRKTVKMVINPYEYPAAEIHYNGFVWLLQPIPKDQYGRLQGGVTYGEYKALPETTTQQAKKELERIATEEWGLTWKGTGDKRRAVAPPLGHSSPLKVFGHQADKVRVDFISRPGSELEVKPQAVPENPEIRRDAATVSRSILSRRMPFMQFMMNVKREIGQIPPELHQRLKALYSDGIEITQAEEVIQQIKAGHWPAATGASDMPEAVAL